MGRRGKQLSRQMGKTFGAWKRHGKGAVLARLCKQATTAVTQMTAAADNAAAAQSCKETTHILALKMTARRTAAPSDDKVGACGSNNSDARTSEATDFAA